MSAILKCMREVGEKTAALKKATTKSEKERAGAELALAEAALARALAPLKPASKTSKYKKTVEEEEESDDDDDDDPDKDDDDEDEDEEEKSEKADEEEEADEEDKKAAKGKSSKSSKKAAKSAKSGKSGKTATRLEALVMSLTGTTDLREAAGRLAAMGDTNASLTKDVKSLKVAQGRDRLERLITLGRADMRITPGNEAKVRDMAKEHGLKAAAAMVDALVPAIGAETFEPNEDDDVVAPKATAQQKKIWAKQGLNEEQMAKAAKVLSERKKFEARIAKEVN